MKKFFVIYIFLIPIAVLGKTYYVSNDGSDKNSGSIEAPFASIQKAADLVQPGDTVLVMPGIYYDSDGDGIIVTLSRGGTADKWVVFKSALKWQGILDGNNHHARYGIIVKSNAKYIKILDFEIRKTYFSAINCNSYTRYVSVEGCHIHSICRQQDTRSGGRSAVLVGENASHVTFDGNVFHTIGRLPTPGADNNYNHDHGLYLCGDYITVTNNIFYDIEAGWGIQIAGAKGAQNHIISNNTFALTNPGRDGSIVIWGAAHDILIQNNIFYAPRGAAIRNTVDCDQKSGIRIRYNLTDAPRMVSTDACGATGLIIEDNNLIHIDPQFVDADGRDYRLKSSSPAIDHGIDEQMPPMDFGKNPRPVGAGVDIGAYEYTGDMESSLYATLVTSPVSPINQDTISIVLITSRPVVQVPSPLQIRDQYGTSGSIILRGALPGNQFEGSFVFDSKFTDGDIFFLLAAGALKDTSGATSSLIKVGGRAVLNRTPPQRPTIRNVLRK